MQKRELGLGMVPHLICKALLLEQCFVLLLLELFCRRQFGSSSSGAELNHNKLKPVFLWTVLTFWVHLLTVGLKTKYRFSVYN